MNSEEVEALRVARRQAAWREMNRLADEGDSLEYRAAFKRWESIATEG